MIEKPTIGDRIFDTFNYLFMFCAMVVTLYPLLYCLYASISNPYQMIAHDGLLLYPLGFSIGSYKMVFKNPMILIGYGNTFVYLVFGTLVNMIFTALGAYFLSRKGLMLQRAISLFIIFTMFFSGGLIPLYLVVQGIGLTNTRWAMILPVAINTYNLIVMRTGFASIPDSMEESARIDGAKDLTILTRIILPLSKATVAVIILFYAAYHWNAWFNALIFLRTRELYPLQIILREILIANDTAASMSGVSGADVEPVSITVKYATVIVATLPILAAYPFVQKYFVRGVMIGAVKG